MQIQLLDNPFPHVIVKNFYNDQELQDIKDEIKFLSKPGKMLDPGVYHGGNQGLTTHKALLLEKTYSNSRVSDILTIFRQKYEEDNFNFVDIIQSKFPSYKKLMYINNTITKVRYYHDGEGYGAHTDIYHDFLAFSYFHTTPKKFTGGELHCTDYNYTIDCSDNTLVLIPGYVKHEVLNTQISDDDYYNGNGRYCVSQFLDASASATEKFSAFAPPP